MGMANQLDLDPGHTVVFPNQLRDLRRKMGVHKLLALSRRIPGIPYVRLSKIERGEVFPKADEISRIAQALEVDPLDLLVDMDAPDFQISNWAAEHMDLAATVTEEDAYAVLLAAAVRMRRATDKALSIAVIDKDYGIPAVSLSRIENASKALDRLNPSLLLKVCQLLGVKDETALRTTLRADFEAGALKPYLADIRNPAQRQLRATAHLAMLRSALGGGAAFEDRPAADMLAGAEGVAEMPEPAHPAPPPLAPARASAQEQALVRLVPVYGSLLPSGLVARTPLGRTVEAPRTAGSNAWGMLVCRPTLGMGMPGRAVVIVDPDRYPVVGGLAVLAEDEGYRLLMVTADRDGALHGHSEKPELDIALDDVPIGRLAAVLAAVFD